MALPLPRLVNAVWAWLRKQYLSTEEGKAQWEQLQAWVMAPPARRATTVHTSTAAVTMTAARQAEAFTAYDAEFGG